MINSFNAFIWDLIIGGSHPKVDELGIRKIIMINTLMLLGMFFLFGIGAMAFVEKHYLLFAADYSMGVTLVIMYWWIRRYGDTRIPGIIYVVMMTCFYSFLVGIGGVHQTAYVWSFSYPMFSIFVLGSKKGIFASMLFLLLVSLIFFLGQHVDYISTYSIDLIVRFVGVFLVISLFIFIMEKTREKTQEALTAANKELRESLNEVQILSGLLPICAKCKKIRDDKGYWNQLEGYIQKHSDAEFSHSICPDCAEALYGNESWYKKKKEGLPAQ